MNLTICIVTFKKRLNLFKNLVSNIKTIYPDINILVAINGEYQEDFCNTYREDILNFISSQKNVFPIMVPEFRSLAKLWNTLLIFSKTEYNLVLNDDVVFCEQNILETIQEYSNQTKSQLFTINYSWSHYVITKTILDDLGYFDERLLCLGHEDGDMVWRYIKMYGNNIPNISISGIYNIADYESKPTNMDCTVDNKPTFNFTFIEEKYKKDTSSNISGMFGSPHSKHIEDYNQYPYEKFYYKNKNNLGDGKKFVF